MFEPIKVLEHKNSMVLTQFLLTVLFYHPFSLFFIIDLYFFITTVISQIFNPTAELEIHIGIQTNEAKAEIEAHSVIAETKVSHFSM